MTQTGTVNTYAAKDIQVLEGLEAVRRRPGMYVGGTDMKALHHLVYEVVDNAIDEALAGYCDQITVTIHPDSSVSVVDNGRGIPVDIHPEKKKSALEVVMTILHAGGKFGGGGYKVSGGLHGVGVSAVNALSEWCEAEVCKDGQVYYQRYERGIPQEPVKVIGDCDNSARGTKITFCFDRTIFKDETLDFRFDTLLQRFREMAFVARRVKIRMEDERGGEICKPTREMTFYFEGGITSFVRYINRSKVALHTLMYVEKDVDGMGVETAIQYTDAYSESVFSFANTINTIDGGAHMTGLRSALTRVINDYARRNNMLKDADGNFSGDDTREGLTAIVSVKVPDPQFESQTKVKLMNPEVQTAVTQVVGEAFNQFMDENPTAARAIISKCLTSARARDAARKARDLVIRKSALESMTLPGKLADCSERNGGRTELFIVEGDSAGGCLVGDTRIALASGICKTIRQLSEDWALGIQHYGFATNESGDVRIVPLVEPRLTKRQASLVEVELDNGERILCTPDHPFRLRDGSYRPASDLNEGDSLMPFKTRLTEADELPAAKYAMVWMNGRGEWNHVQAIGEAYESLRLQTAPTALSYQRLLKERYAGDEQKLLEAARNVNCKVVAVRALAETADVYDITVDGYHNFALDSGVFVHNSAKQGRDRHFQAILPLRGKILNTERARLDKILGNNEVKALISALGTGVGETFDVKNLRYGRVMIMSVAGDELTFVKTPQGQTLSVRVGDFIDSLFLLKEDPSEYQVLCFDPEGGEVRFRPIKSVIRHDHSGALFQLETAYGRSVTVTGEHSVFVAGPDGKPTLKRGDQIAEGDLLVAPGTLALHSVEPADRLDLLSFLISAGEHLETDLVVRGTGVEAWYQRRVRVEYQDQPEMVEPRVTIPATVGAQLQQQRQASGLSQAALCAAAGIRQPVTYYAWEQGRSRPTLSHFNRYVQAIGLNPSEILEQVTVGDSRLDHSWKTQYRAAPRNRIRDYVAMRDLPLCDLPELGEDVSLSPRHYANQHVARYLPLNADLFMLLGFFTAEGALSQRNGVRLAIGKRNQARLPELKRAIYNVFGLEPKEYSYRDGRAGELRILNRVVTTLFQLLFGVENSQSSLKRIPDMVFNTSRENQMAYLRGYFLGDGTLGGGMSFTTRSALLADQLTYLLLNLDIQASVIEHEPSAKPGLIHGKPVITRHKYYTIHVGGRKNLRQLAPVWGEHANAERMQAYLQSDRRSGTHPRHQTPLVGGLVGLPVRAVRRVEVNNQKVYDFSVEGDETFICGRGGICCHNTDADVDGAHIRTLLLTFFFRYMQPLIDQGHLFIAQPPLYRLSFKNQERYVFSDTEKDQAIREMSPNKEKVALQRYKGLGEMNPQQLWETTMNPEKRVILQVGIEDAAAADRTFDMLMGAAVPPRNRFITTHAKDVINLDV